MEPQQIPHIKANAIINLTVGGEMISRIQRTLMFLTKDLSEKESTDLQQKIASGRQLSEKENAIATMSTLILAISNIAKETGQLEYRTVEDTFSTLHP
jgi:CO dehydrogenase/acetyl-CoA synthase epsilon subunit